MHDIRLALRTWGCRAYGASLPCAIAAVVLGLMPVACGKSEGDGRGQPADTVQSAVTTLATDECRREADPTDPNGTPYWVCPGVAGYSLIVRRVDAGRRSIDVVDAEQRVTPLNLQDVVTRHMFTLAPRAEWRVAGDSGGAVPTALILRLEAHEDNAEPERVTRSFVAVAKLSVAGVCVTDRILEGPGWESAARVAADSAAVKPCVPALPPMTVDGVIVR